MGGFMEKLGEMGRSSWIVERNLRMAVDSKKWFSWVFLYFFKYFFLLCNSQCKLQNTYFFSSISSIHTHKKKQKVTNHSGSGPIGVSICTFPPPVESSFSQINFSHGAIEFDRFFPRFYLFNEFSTINAVSRDRQPSDQHRQRTGAVL